MAATDSVCEMTPRDFARQFRDILKVEPNMQSASRMTDLLRNRLAWIFKHEREINSELAGPNTVHYLRQFLEYIVRECPTDDTSLRQTRTYLYRFLRDMCVNACALSEGLTEARVPELVGKDVESLQGIYQYKKDTQKLVEYALSFLFNCACYPALRNALREQVLTSLLSYVDPQVNHVERVVDAIVTIQLLDESNTCNLHEYLFPHSFFETLSDLVGRLVYSEKEGSFIVNYNPDGSGTFVYADQLIICLRVLCDADHYKCPVLDIMDENERQVKDFLIRGNPKHEQKLIRALLEILTTHDCTYCPGGSYAASLLKTDASAVPSAGGRTDTPTCSGEQRAPHTIVRAPSKDYMYGGKTVSTKNIGSFLSRAGSKEKVCSYFEKCGRFLCSLNIPGRVVDSRHNACFCEPCMAKRGDRATYSRGKPPQMYAVPGGWAKFALRTPVRADILNIWDLWHVAYHGTRPENILKILQTGELLLPGDVMMSGGVLNPPAGHFTDNRKPEGFDIRQVFLSPSILYSGLNVYAPKAWYSHEETRENGWGRVAFQVRVKPGTYTIGPETVGARNKTVDPLFKNSELEWSTPNRGAVILTGILIKVEHH